MKLGKPFTYCTQNTHLTRFKRSHLRFYKHHQIPCLPLPLTQSLPRLAFNGFNFWIH